MEQGPRDGDDKSAGDVGTDNGQADPGDSEKEVASANYSISFGDVNGSDELLDMLDAVALPARAEPSAKRKEARRKANARSRFVIPAKSAAIASAFVTLASLASLAVVADAQGANGLATIALALAILAFVIQIMVFIYQSQTSHQQMLQSEQLYTETRALLTEVRTAANSTETLVREQFRDLLKAFMDAAATSSEGEGEQFDSAAFERRLVEMLRREIATGPASATAANAAGRDETTGRARSEANRARTELLRRRRQVANLYRTFPDESDGKPALEKLKTISSPARERLQDLARDEISSRERSTYLGLAVEEVDDELFDAGLATKARVETGQSRLMVSRLTDEGRTAARLLTAVGDIPGYAGSDLPL